MLHNYAGTRIIRNSHLKQNASVTCQDNPAIKNPFLKFISKKCLKGNQSMINMFKVKYFFISYRAIAQREIGCKIKLTK